MNHHISNLSFASKSSSEGEMLNNYLYQNTRKPGKKKNITTKEGKKKNKQKKKRAPKIG